MRKLFFAILLMQGCVTPYGPRGFTGGYTDQKLAEGRYAVTFEGNGFTPYSTVYQYAMQRARQLCLKDDYDSINVISVNGDTVSGQVGGNSYNCKTTGSDGNYNTNCRQSTPITVQKSHVSLVVECLAEEVEEVAEPQTKSALKLTSSSDEGFRVLAPRATVTHPDGRKAVYTSGFYLEEGTICNLSAKQDGRLLSVTLACAGHAPTRIVYSCALDPGPIADAFNANGGPLVLMIDKNGKDVGIVNLSCN